MSARSINFVLVEACLILTALLIGGHFGVVLGVCFGWLIGWGMGLTRRDQERERREEEAK